VDDDDIERRKADWHLYSELVRDGFEGPRWNLCATELARYAHGVLMAWLVTGEVFRQCAADRRRLGRPPADWTCDDRAELANETVAEALRRFRKDARNGGGWRPEGGASLTTYFTRTCRQEFPNVFRRWLSEQRSWRRFDPVELTPDLAAEISDDPIAIVMQNLRIREVLTAIPDPITRAAVILQCCKYTYDEIAEILYRPPGAIAQRLHRERRRQQGNPKVTPDE
jgi:DNA-directed RNA polymerase specialized sigma24 family protein